MNIGERNAYDFRYRLRGPGISVQLRNLVSPARCEVDARRRFLGDRGGSAALAGFPALRMAAADPRQRVREVASLPVEGVHVERRTFDACGVLRAPFVQVIPEKIKDRLSLAVGPLRSRSERVSASLM